MVGVFTPGRAPPDANAETTGVDLSPLAGYHPAYVPWDGRRSA
jgi:hypothetical protein